MVSIQTSDSGTLATQERKFQTQTSKHIVISWIYRIMIFVGKFADVTK